MKQIKVFVFGNEVNEKELNDFCAGHKVETVLPPVYHPHAIRGDEDEDSSSALVVMVVYEAEAPSYHITVPIIE